MHEIPLDRTIRLFGDINSENVQKVEEKIHELLEKDPNEWVNLVITSLGGDTVLGFGLYDVLKRVRNLQTTAVGEVTSIAILVFMAGKRRIAMKNIRMFFHETQLHVAADTSFSLSGLKRRALQMEKDHELYERIIAENTNGRSTQDLIADICHKEVTLGIDKLLDWGIVHSVLE